MYRFAAKYRWISAFQLLLVACSMIWSSPMVAAAPLQSLHYDQLETVLHTDDRDDAAHHVALGEFVAEVEVETQWEDDTHPDPDQNVAFAVVPVPGYTVPRHVVWPPALPTYTARYSEFSGVKRYLRNRVLRI